MSQQATDAPTNEIMQGTNYAMAKFRRVDPTDVIQARPDSQITTVINDTDDELDDDSVISQQSDQSVIILEDDDIYGESGTSYTERIRMQRRLDISRELILEKLDLLEVEPHLGSLNRQIVHRLEEFNRVLNSFLF